MYKGADVTLCQSKRLETLIAIYFPKVRSWFPRGRLSESEFSEWFFLRSLYLTSTSIVLNLHNIHNQEVLSSL